MMDENYTVLNAVYGRGKKNHDTTKKSNKLHEDP